MLRHLRPAFQRRGTRPRRRVSGQHLHHAAARVARRGHGRRRRLRRRLDSFGQDGSRLRRLRPALRRRGRPPGRRVPGQHLHAGLPDRSRRGAWTPTATSSSPGRATARTAPATASSPGATTPPGVPQGAEFRVNTYTTDYQTHPSRRPWTPTATSSSPGRAIAGRLRLRHLRPALQRRRRAPRPPSSGSTPTPSSTQSHPAVAMDADGDFVVAWQSYVQDGSSYGIFARRFNAAGVAQGGEFQVNTYTTGNQYATRGGAWTPTATSSSPGQSDGQDGSAYRRLRPALRASPRPSTSTATARPKR